MKKVERRDSRQKFLLKKQNLIDIFFKTDYVEFSKAGK